MKLVGVKWYSMWITWLIRIMIPYFILSFIWTVVVSVVMEPRIKYGINTKKALFKYTDFFTGFSIFFVYSVQTAMFCLLLGQIFSKSKYKEFL